MGWGAKILFAQGADAPKTVPRAPVHVAITVQRENLRAIFGFRRFFRSKKMLLFINTTVHSQILLNLNGSRVMQTRCTHVRLVKHCYLIPIAIRHLLFIFTCVHYVYYSCKYGSYTCELYLKYVLCICVMNAL